MTKGKIIQLTQGKYALVDTSDYEMLSKRKWHLFKADWGGLYATAHHTKPNGKVTQIRMHRLIMNAKPEQIIDHINGDGLDNRKSNLRFCTQSQNRANTKRVGGLSKFRGVYYNKTSKKWASQISLNNKKKWIGYFNTEVEAARAYDKMAKKLFGEFARVNNYD